MLIAALLTILVWFDGVPTTCLVDTGATSTLLRQSVAARIGTLGPSAGAATFQTVGNSAFAGEWRWARDVGTRLIGWDGGYIAVVPDAAMNESCVLGTDFLARQPIALDWAQQQLSPVVR